MDKTNASKILNSYLDEFGNKTIEELLGLVEEEFELKNTFYKEINDSENSCYQIRINVYWRDKKKDCLWISGAIDDGGFSAFIPLTGSKFIEFNSSNV